MSRELCQAAIALGGTLAKVERALSAKRVSMRVDLYTRCWNDADMLGFMFRHYDRLVQRYVVFDDGSTDASLDILRSNPKVEIRPMPPYSDPESRVASGLAVLENCWKESRGVADWVIVTDIDEHLWHPNLEKYLLSLKNQGVTIVPALGFQMMSEHFPDQDCHLSETVTMGAPSPVMSKMNILSPNDIEATNFSAGRHSASPLGNVVAPARDELLLLHYRYLGLERLYLRQRQALSRQRAKDLAFKWGFHYSWSKEQLLEDWNEVAAQLVDTSNLDLRPWQTHAGPRWWDEMKRAGVGNARPSRWSPSRLWPFRRA
jgi:hypothetical protein